MVGHPGGVAEAGVLGRHVGVGGLEALVHARVAWARQPGGPGRRAVVVAELPSVGDQRPRHVHGHQPQPRQQRHGNAGQPATRRGGGIEEEDRDGSWVDL